MMKQHPELTQWGFSPDYTLETPPTASADLVAARVVQVQREYYVVCDGRDQFFVELPGAAVFNATAAEDFPTIGDFVLVQPGQMGAPGVLVETFRRKNLLKRATPERKFGVQLMGANIDFALVVVALLGDFNIARLERYMAVIADGGLPPVIILTKSDLVSPSKQRKQIAKLHDRFTTTPCFTISNTTGTGWEELEKLFCPQKTYCLLGSSGVGKTTIVNHLHGEDRFETSEVRKRDHKGRHTTTARTLSILPSGALLIDNPGIREINVTLAKDGLEETFEDLTLLAKQCKFRNCGHGAEPGCAIRPLVERGKVAAGRFANFLKMRTEQATGQPGQGRGERPTFRKTQR